MVKSGEESRVVGIAWEEGTMGQGPRLRGLVEEWWPRVLEDRV